MKCAVILTFLCLYVVILKADRPNYTTKYDNINVDDILKSDRLTNNYANCFLGKGTCTPDGQGVKDTLQDALESDCVRCSAKQWELGQKVIKHLVKNRKAVFDELAAKFDPEGKYADRYRETFKKEGIEI